MVILGFLVTFLTLNIFAFAIQIFLDKKQIYREDSILRIIVSYVFAILILLIIGLIAIFNAPISITTLGITFIFSIAYGLNREPNFLKMFLRLEIILWFCICVICTMIFSLQLEKPSELKDGPYVFKEWTAPVKSQWIAGSLPVDNALQYYAAEFFFNKVDLKENHPFLPGQEIISRPIGSGLLYLAIRGLIDDQRTIIEIPKFSYVGSEWPDATVFYDTDRYNLYQGNQIVFQSFLLFILFYLYQFIYKAISASVGVAIGSIPFFVSQSVYVWNKNMVCALGLIAIILLMRKKYISTSITLGLAYLIHPMAIIFIIAINLHFLIINLKNLSKTRILENLKINTGFFVTYLIWRVFSLGTGLTDDLIAQRLKDQKLLDHVAARLNSINLLFGNDFLSVYPWNLQNFINGLVQSGMLYPIALLVIAIFIQPKKISITSEMTQLLRISILILLVTLLLYSIPAPIQFFGGQFIMITLYLWALLLNQKIISRLMIAANTSIIGAWIYSLHPIGIF